MTTSSETYRNSQLSQLRLCRFAYKKTYLDGDKGLPSPSLQRGSAVHRAISEVVRSIVNGSGLIDVHEIAYRVTRGGQPEYTDVLDVLTRFQESLGEYIVIDPSAVFLVEERLEMPVELSDGTEVTYFGTPDLVSRQRRKVCIIEDWKTHWHPETESEFLADQQLLRYALLIDHHFGDFESFVVRKHFVRYRGSMHERELSSEDLGAALYDLRTEIEHAREVEAAGEFEPTGGGWCGVCTHHASCPLITEYREKGEDWLSIPGDEHASLLAQTAIALGEASNRIKDQLKTYLGNEHATGAVRVAGGEYGYGPVQKREIAVADLREVLEERGADLPEWVLRVDLKALENLLKSLPRDLSNAVEEAMREYESSRCAFRRTPRPSLAAPHVENPEEEEALV